MPVSTPAKACSPALQRFVRPPLSSPSRTFVSLHSIQRVLSVAGVADAIHIATYYIGNILIEAQERMPSAGTAMSSYRPSNRSTTRSTPYVGSSYVPGYSNPYVQTAPSRPR